MRFVIIGGDAAGMSAASRAGRLRKDLEIIVFEQTHDVSYSACGMPYNIADPEDSMETLVVRRADDFREKQGVDLRTGHRVDRIDRKNHIITGEKETGEPFECCYDKLLIATGASSIVPDIPGINNEGVYPLKSLHDGRTIRQYLEDGNVKKAVILGMGYIAMEMADALRKRGVHVAMVKPRKRLLPWLNEELSHVIFDELEKNGVELYPGHRVDAIEKAGSGLMVVCDDRSFECQLVVPAVGVKPNIGIAASAGLELDDFGAISVDRRGCTSDPDIYAAGDCADAFSVVTGKKVWVPLALHANRSGRVAAENICGMEIGLKGIACSAVFKVFDLEVARAGINPAEARAEGFDPLEVVIASRSRAHGHPGNKTIHVAMTGDKKTGRLLGAQMAGVEGVAHRVHSFAVALHNSMSAEDFWQTDLAYAPPFGPVWDPLLTAAGQLLRKSE
jgi:NADPH-dependent 2,4-dienoyl-CoA reductase/sulfur reductase-like enzyme